ncbi:MAG: hypothetical protein R3C02_03360 [Planctomycetaceae bacterium]
MRETTSAITRVALLVIMTGMFATAWSNDQRTQTAFIIARREAAQTTRQVAQVKVTPTTPVAHTTECSLDKQPVVMQVTVDLTLPPDITPGTFRVVQPTGAMFTINVSASGSVTVPPRDVYVVEVAEGERNCFIRIDQPESVIHQRPTTASRQKSTVR